MYLNHKIFFSRQNYSVMEDHFGFIGPLLFLQNIYGFRIIGDSGRHKIRKVLDYFYTFCLILLFFYISREIINFHLERLKVPGGNYLSRLVVLINVTFYNFTTLSFYFNYLRIKKYSSRIIYGLKSLDERCFQHFEITVDHKKSSRLITKSLLLPTIFIVVNEIRTLSDVQQHRNETFVVILSHIFFDLFLILQLYFYAFLLVCVFARLKTLNSEILKSIKREKFSEFKMNVLLLIFDDIFVMLKNIKKGFSSNVLLVLSKNLSKLSKCLTILFNFLQRIHYPKPSQTAS